MGPQLSKLELKILEGLQNPLPGTMTPYRDLARLVGIETKQLLGILKKWKQQGKIRRIGAVVNHFKLASPTGALVVWQLEPEKVRQIGEILANFQQVSHAYERKTTENWPYNIYTMVHAKDNRHLSETIKRMSKACGVTNYRVLKTEKELKKTPPKYINESKNELRYGKD